MSREAERVYAELTRPGTGLSQLDCLVLADACEELGKAEEARSYRASARPGNHQFCFDFCMRCVQCRRAWGDVQALEANLRRAEAPPVRAPFVRRRQPARVQRSGLERAALNHRGLP